MVVIIYPDKLSKGVLSSQVFNLKHLYGDDTQFFYFEGLKLVSENVENLPDQQMIDYFYARQPLDYFKLRILYPTKKIIYDFRGLAFSESYLRNKSYLRSVALILRDFIIYITATKIQAVSNNLKAWLQLHFWKRSIKVVPCCINSKQLMKRQKRSDEKLKFVYSGGSSKYQCIDEVLQIYQLIKSRTDRDCILDIFTNDVNFFEKKLKNYNISSTKVLSFSQDQIIKELSNYDFGFLIRDDIILNKVASPVKAMEYCAAGLEPIYTSNVGDYSNIFDYCGLGLNISNKSDNEIIEFFNSYSQKVDVSDRLYELAKSYTWEKFCE